MKLSTILLIGAAGFIGYTVKKNYDAKQAAKATAAAPPPPPQPITDTSTAVTSIQRTVNDPGTNSDQPTLNDQNYAGGAATTTTWGGGRQGSNDYSSNWGGYRG